MKISGGTQHIYWLIYISGTQFIDKKYRHFQQAIYASLKNYYTIPLGVGPTTIPEHNRNRIDRGYYQNEQKQNCRLEDDYDYALLYLYSILKRTVRLLVFGKTDTKKLKTMETQQIGKITLLLLLLLQICELIKKKKRWSQEHFLVFAGIELADAYSPLFGLFL